MSVTQTCSCSGFLAVEHHLQCILKSGCVEFLYSRPNFTSAFLNTCFSFSERKNLILVERPILSDEYQRRRGTRVYYRNTVDVVPLVFDQKSRMYYYDSWVIVGISKGQLIFTKTSKFPKDIKTANSYLAPPSVFRKEHAYCCPLCSTNAFKSWKRLAQHMAGRHCAHIESYVCQCGLYTPYKSTLATHRSKGCNGKYLRARMVRGETREEVLALPSAPEVLPPLPPRYYFLRKMKLTEKPKALVLKLRRGVSLNSAERKLLHKLHRLYDHAGETFDAQGGQKEMFEDVFSFIEDQVKSLQSSSPVKFVENIALAGMAWKACESWTGLAATVTHLLAKYYPGLFTRKTVMNLAHYIGTLFGRAGLALKGAWSDLFSSEETAEGEAETEASPVDPCDGAPWFVTTIVDALLSFSHFVSKGVTGSWYKLRSLAGCVRDLTTLKKFFETAFQWVKEQYNWYVHGIEPRTKRLFNQTRRILAYHQDLSNVPVAEQSIKWSSDIMDMNHCIDEHENDSIIDPEYDGGATRARNYLLRDAIKYGRDNKGIAQSRLQAATPRVEPVALFLEGEAGLWKTGIMEMLTKHYLQHTEGISAESSLSYRWARPQGERMDGVAPHHKVYVYDDVCATTDSKDRSMVLAELLRLISVTPFTPDMAHLALKGCLQLCPSLVMMTSNIVLKNSANTGMTSNSAVIRRFLKIKITPKDGKDYLETRNLLSKIAPPTVPLVNEHLKITVQSFFGVEVETVITYEQLVSLLVARRKSNFMKNKEVRSKFSDIELPPPPLLQSAAMNHLSEEVLAPVFTEAVCQTYPNIEEILAMPQHKLVDKVLSMDWKTFLDLFQTRTNPPTRAHFTKIKFGNYIYTSGPFENVTRRSEVRLTDLPDTGSAQSGMGKRYTPSFKIEEVPSSESEEETPAEAPDEEEFSVLHNPRFNLPGNLPVGEFPNPYRGPAIWIATYNRYHKKFHAIPKDKRVAQRRMLQHYCEVYSLLEAHYHHKDVVGAYEIPYPPQDDLRMAIAYFQRQMHDEVIKSKVILVIAHLNERLNDSIEEDDDTSSDTSDSESTEEKKDSSYFLFDFHRKKAKYEKDAGPGFFSQLFLAIKTFFLAIGIFFLQKYTQHKWKLIVSSAVAVLAGLTTAFALFWCTKTLTAYVLRRLDDKLAPSVGEGKYKKDEPSTAKRLKSLKPQIKRGNSNAQAEADNSTQDTLTAIKKNQFVVFGEQNPSVKTRLLGIGSHYFLTSNHEWLRMKLNTSVKIIGFNTVTTVLVDTIEPCSFEIGDSELANEVLALRIPKLTCKNIVSKFRTALDWNTNGTYTAYVQVYEPTIKGGDYTNGYTQIPVTRAVVSMTRLRVTSAAIPDEGIEASEGIAHATLVGRGDTFSGCCSSPWVVVDSSSDRKIAGIHIARNDRSGAVCGVILKEWLDELIIDENVPPPDMFTADGEAACFPNTTSIGRLTPPYQLKSSPPHTRFRRSMVPFPREYDTLSPSLNSFWEIDSDNRFRFRRENYQVALSKHIIKMARVSRCPSLFSSFVPEFYGEEFLSIVLRDMPTAITSLTEALNGSREFGTSSVNLKANKGFPECREYPRGLGKFPCIQRNPEEVIVIGDEYEKLLTQRVMGVLRGSYPNYSILSWKDELLDNSIVETGKVRLYMAGNIPHYIVGDRLLGKFFSRLSIHCKWFGPGLNMLGSDAHFAYRYITGNSPDRTRVIMLDISGMDVSEDYELLRNVYAGIATVLFKHPDFSATWKEGYCNWSNLAIDQYWIFKNILMRVSGKMGSGMRFTAEVNTVVLISIHAFIFCLYLVQEEGYSWKDARAAFHEDIRGLFYGDDSLITIREGMYLWYTPAFIVSQAQVLFGMKFTSAIKDQEPAYVDLAAVSFLKRTFHEMHGYMVARRSLKDIYATLFWWKKTNGMDVHSAVKAKVESAIIELAQYPRDVFVRELGVINKALAEAGHNCHHASWDEYRDVYLKTFDH